MRRLVLLAFIAIAPIPAQAGILSFGGQGQLGDQQFVFNRYQAFVVDSKKKLGAVKDPLKDSIADSPADDPGGYYRQTQTRPEKTIGFERTDDAERKLTLTEKSSKTLSKKHKLICGRDEDSATYRKVFTYQREDEPAREITMQCVEYSLSTRGGRPCN